jgi:hypothetical protein
VSGIQFTPGVIMIKNLMKAILAKEERKLGESIDWARYLVDKAIAVFSKYLLALPLLSQWKYSPAEAISISRLIAVQNEDCGSCVQIEINMAKRRNVNRELIQCVLQKKYEKLDGKHQHVARFTEAVINRTGFEKEMGDRVKDAFGEKAFLEISLSIATSRFYPTIKRALGYSTECKIENFRV